MAPGSVLTEFFFTMAHNIAVALLVAGQMRTTHPVVTESFQRVRGAMLLNGFAVYSFVSLGVKPECQAGGSNETRQCNIPRLREALRDWLGGSIRPDLAPQRPMPRGFVVH